MLKNMNLILLSPDKTCPRLNVQTKYQVTNMEYYIKICPVYHNHVNCSQTEMGMYPL